MSRRYRSGPKRPIEKFNTNGILTQVGPTKQTVDLFTANMAQTLVGLKINGNIYVDPNEYGAVVIAVVREGNSANEISFTNGQSQYEPEQDVLWSFLLGGITDQNSVNIDDDSKAMRKLNNGDKIVLIVDGSTSDSTNCYLNVTGWLKQ